MFDFHEKRKIKSFLYSKPVIFALFFIAIVMSATVYDRYVVAKEMEGKLETKRAELEHLKQRAQTLDAKVKYLEDERGIEEELRNRFDVAREGEQVVVLIDPKKTDMKATGSLPQKEEQEHREEKSFFSFLTFWSNE
jgi:cell division protein FtsB